MTVTFGDGTSPIPPIGAEIKEQLRACYRIAQSFRARLSGDVSVRIEADVAPQLTRFAVHYQVDTVPSAMRTIEVDFHPNCPLEDEAWVGGIVNRLLDLIKENESDLIFDQPLDYLRLVDSEGKTIFENGKAFEIGAPRTKGT